MKLLTACQRSWTTCLFAGSLTAGPGDWPEKMKELSPSRTRSIGALTQKASAVFVGSSSIRFWDLEKWFPKQEPTPLNRGFGGSEIRDSIVHLDRVVLRHRPRVVVLYAGDNDIAGGKSAETVVADFEEFVAKTRSGLPDVRLAYVAIKPSLARWKLASEMQQANERIEATCAKDNQLTFVDIWGPMLGDDGRPRPELFRSDGLHLNAEGYALWTKLVLPVLADKAQLRL